MVKLITAKEAFALSNSETNIVPLTLLLQLLLDCVLLDIVLSGILLVSQRIELGLILVGG
jgi:hypothetical protein